ncbi:MAG: hypothetical protein HC860_19430 [Alkalinema sp. RU_4_3]|nr:hypothetical protein [Alkalinema sp. RU_4_3]
MKSLESFTVSVLVTNPCDEERILHVVASERWNLLIPSRATYELKFENASTTSIKIEYTEWNGIHVEGCPASTVAIYYDGDNLIPEVLLPKKPPDETAIVKVGTFLCDEKVVCDVCIAKVNWIQDDEFVYYFPEGQGEHMHIAIDRFEELYCPWYGSTVKRGEFVTSGGVYPSVQAAIESVMKSSYVGNTLQWLD